MSIADLLPVRISHLRPVRKPKHRASDEVQRLQFLLDGARALIAGLQLQLDDRDRDHAGVVARIEERHGEVVRGLENQIADLERRLEVRVLAEHVVAKTQEIDVDAVRRACTPVPLHQAPFATTDPGRVPPSWATPDPAA